MRKVGIGFAVSILIATLAFTGTELAEAKLGVLSTVIAAPAVTWLVFRATALLPAPAADSPRCPSLIGAGLGALANRDVALVGRELADRFGMLP